METKKLAIQLFNETWDLIDKADRTTEDNALMLHKAHTSCYLWMIEETSTPTNHARGEWQVSRVYALLGMGEPALLHGQRSLDICLANGIGDFDLAFGYEAVARAKAVLGDASGAAEVKSLARTAAEAIAEQGDKDYVLSELETIRAVVSAS